MYKNTTYRSVLLQLQKQIENVRQQQWRLGNSYTWLGMEPGPLPHPLQHVYWLDLHVYVLVWRTLLNIYAYSHSDNVTSCSLLIEYLTIELYNNSS